MLQSNKNVTNYIKPTSIMILSSLSLMGSFGTKILFKMCSSIRTFQKLHLACGVSIHFISVIQNVLKWPQLPPYLIQIKFFCTILLRKPFFYAAHCRATSYFLWRNLHLVIVLGSSNGTHYLRNTAFCMPFNW